MCGRWPEGRRGTTWMAYWQQRRGSRLHHWGGWWEDVAKPGGHIWVPCCLLLWVLFCLLVGAVVFCFILFILCCDLSLCMVLVTWHFNYLSLSSTVTSLLADDDNCPSCETILAELETIDDETDEVGIQFVKTNDVDVAEDLGISHLPALVYFEGGVPSIYDGAWVGWSWMPPVSPLFTHCIPLTWNRQHIPWSGYTLGVITFFYLFYSHKLDFFCQTFFEALRKLKHFVNCDIEQVKSSHFFSHYSFLFDFGWSVWHSNHRKHISFFLPLFLWYIIC